MGPWVWMDGGARVAKARPIVLRRFLRECCVGRWARVAVDTAHSMMNERSRAHHNSMDTTRRGALLIQEYVTAGWRSMRAVRLVPTPLTAHANPLEKFVGSGSPEPLLMNTEGLRGVCGGYRVWAGPRNPRRPGSRVAPSRALRFVFWGRASEFGVSNLGMFLRFRGSEAMFVV